MRRVWRQEREEGSENGSPSSGGWRREPLLVGMSIREADMSKKVSAPVYSAGRPRKGPIKRSLSVAGCTAVEDASLW